MVPQGNGAAGAPVLWSDLWREVGGLVTYWRRAAGAHLRDLERTRRPRPRSSSGRHPHRRRTRTVAASGGDPEPGEPPEHPGARPVGAGT